MSEVMVVAVVALVAIGPKDLPRTLRAMGRVVARVRSLSGEFNRHVDDMLREADLEDVKQQVQNISGQGLSKTIEAAVDPDGTVKRGLELPEMEMETERGGDPDAPYLGDKEGEAPVTVEIKDSLPAIKTETTGGAAS